MGRLLKDLDYALHVNAKKREASSNHPDRDQQFDYIAVQRATFTAAGLPILSIDAKKKLRHEVARSDGRSAHVARKVLRVAEQPVLVSPRSQRTSPRHS